MAVENKTDDDGPGLRLPSSPAAWNILSVKLHRHIARQLRGQASVAEVEELTQETLLQLVRRSRAEASRDHTVSSQAYTIAAGLIANRKRRLRRQDAYWTNPERIPEREALQVQLPLDQIVDYRLAVQRLHRCVSNDNGKATVLRATLLGVRGHQEAAPLGLSKAEFENAKKRLERLVKKISTATPRS